MIIISNFSTPPKNLQKSHKKVLTVGGWLAILKT
nr:MAG TPA: hypothetical protein [Caudoviricetes sp.]